MGDAEKSRWVGKPAHVCGEHTHHIMQLNQRGANCGTLERPANTPTADSHTDRVERLP